MTLINLILVDQDFMFVDAFREYTLKDSREKINITIFTDKSLLVKFLSRRSQEYDLALISSGFDIDLSYFNPKNTLILLDKYQKSELKGFNTISKFSNINEILNKAMELLNKNKYVLNPIKKSNLICVTSAAGGAGKSTLLKAAALDLQRSGKKCLYLDLQDITSMKYSELGMSSLFLKIKENQVKPVSELRRNIVTMPDGIDSIASPISALDYNELGEEDYRIFLEAILELEYDFVAADLSSAFSIRNNVFLGHSNYILNLITDQTICKLKSRNFIIDLERVLRNYSWKGKLIIIGNKLSGTLSSVDDFGIPDYAQFAPGIPFISGLDESEAIQIPGMEQILNLIGV